MFTKNRENPFLDAYLIISNKFIIDLKVVVRFGLEETTVPHIVY